MSGKHQTSSGFRIVSLPSGGVPKRIVFETMLHAAESGDPTLPQGWEIEWQWRNNPKQELRHDSFQNVISQSRPGFWQLMAMRIRKEIERLGIPQPPPAEVREAAESEIEEIEELQEEFLEERRERESKRRKRRKAKRRRKAVPRRKRKAPKRRSIRKVSKLRGKKAKDRRLRKR
jgi:hypothetical protein